MRNTIPKWYLVKYLLNGKFYEEEMSTIETENNRIKADFNTELDDRFYGENRYIIERKRIETPKEMMIPGLEEYYEQEKRAINMFIQEGIKEHLDDKFLLIYNN